MDFFKQIKAEADHSLSAGGCRDCGRRVCSIVKEDFVAMVVKKEAVSINRHALTTKRNDIESANRLGLYSAASLECLLLRAVKQ